MDYEYNDMHRPLSNEHEQKLLRMHNKYRHKSRSSNMQEMASLNISFGHSTFKSFQSISECVYFFLECNVLNQIA